MNFAVDVNMQLQGILGWVACIEIAKVKLYKNGILLGSEVANLYRGDVKDAGLHTTGCCGFSFDASVYELREGDVYDIEIQSEGRVVNVARLYGDHKKLLEEFVQLELLPRNEISYLLTTAEDLFKEVPFIFAYKRLIIRLRRGKRGKQSAGVFVGYDYESKESDFSCFRTLTERYLSVWTSFLDSRYLWSVLDTFADYGAPIERLAALAASNYMYAERFYQTQHCLYNVVEKNNEGKVLSYQLQYWGGMKTNQLSRDDAMDVFLTRNLELLNEAPVIKKIFFELLDRSTKEPRSLLGLSISNSDYFSSAYKIYREKYIK